MSTASANEPLPSLPKWALLMFGRFVSGILVWGISLTVFSGLALLVVPRVYPAAEPFLWLVIWGNTLGIMGYVNSTRVNDDLEEFLNHIADLSGYEFAWYFLVMVSLLVGGLGLQVSLFGVLGAYVAEIGYGPFAIVVTVLLPIVDGMLARSRIGWSVASTGALAAFGAVYLLSYLQGVSTEVTIQAGSDIRRAMS